MDLFRTYQQKAFLVVEFHCDMLFGAELLSLTRLDRMITVVTSVRDAVERDVFLG